MNKCKKRALDQVAATSECSIKRIICKTWNGILANSADPDQTPQKAASD